MKMKKGAASFYIVAFSTLILVIIASSFAGVIISVVTRSSNDDLSQSAYDAALAGVEDAKVAYANYQRCIAANPKLLTTQKPSALTSESTANCSDIVYWMLNPDCDMVGHILGRIGKFENDTDVLSQGVLVSDTVETTDGGRVESDLNQAYTCVKIETKLNDYRATLTSANQIRVVKVDFTNVAAKDVKQVRVSWYSNRDDVTSYSFSDLMQTSDGTLTSSGYRVTFQPANLVRVSTPPTIEVQLVQTGGTSFTLANFDNAVGNATNRATVYLVPTDKEAAARGSSERNYQGVYNPTSKINEITQAQIASTNNRATNNVPFVVYCANADNFKSTDEFACSALLNLPDPVGGDRNSETFMMAVTLPYGQPDTDFALEFLCAEGNMCTKVVENGVTVEESRVAQVDGAQVVIDSTGRANDLYRRVEVRLESANTSFAYPIYAVEMLNQNSPSTSTAIKKMLTVTKENTAAFRK